MQKMSASSSSSGVPATTGRTLRYGHEADPPAGVPQQNLDATHEDNNPDSL